MRKNQVRSRERADFQEHVNTLRCDTVVVSVPACRLHWVFWQKKKKTHSVNESNWTAASSRHSHNNAQAGRGEFLSVHDT